MSQSDSDLLSYSLVTPVLYATKERFDCLNRLYKCFSNLFEKHEAYGNGRIYGEMRLSRRITPFQHCEISLLVRQRTIPRTLRINTRTHNHRRCSNESERETRKRSPPSPVAASRGSASKIESSCGVERNDHWRCPDRQDIGHHRPNGCRSCSRNGGASVKRKASARGRPE